MAQRRLPRRSLPLSPFRVGSSITERLLGALQKAWYKNTPYVFGGRFESQGGLDCAGFVCLLEEAAFGVDVDPDHELIYTSAKRIREASEPIATGNERTGDLVFFKNTYPTVGASHIGIILDPVAKTMLDDHERDQTLGPGLTNYASAYWSQHFLGFGRIRQ